MAEIKITKEDLSIPVPEVGGTSIVIQRNAEALRKKEEGANTDLEIGDLLPESKKETYRQSQKVINDFFSKLSDDDKKGVDILVVASDPRLSVRNIVHTESLRTIETANEILRSIRDYFSQNNLSDRQILNNSASYEKSVVEVSEIKTPYEVSDWPELGEYLETKALETKENIMDLYRKGIGVKEREKLHIEGPQQVADRMENFLAFTRASANYHKLNKDRRLILWAVTHFDTLNPYLELTSNEGTMEDTFYSVDYLAGMTLLVEKSGDETKAIIGNKEYQTNLIFPLIERLD